MIIHNKDIIILTKLFKIYKEDVDGRTYNYALFAFLYYEYGLFVSFKHLYNNKLFKKLEAYRYDKNRDKPSLKTDVLQRLNNCKSIILLTQYETNIYLENIINFTTNLNSKKRNHYVLSYLVDITHDLKASKDFMESLTGKRDTNTNYKNLPIPINTLLLTPQQIIN